MSSTERKKKEEGASATTPALRDGDEPETKTSSDAATRKEKQQQQVTTVKKGSSSTRKMPRGQLEQRLSQLAEEVQSLRHGQNRILRYLGNLSALPSMQDDLNDIKSSIGALKQMRVHALQDTSASTTRAPAADIGEFTSTMRNEAVEGVEQSEGNVKIWTGTWNVGAKDPFEGVDLDSDPRAIEEVLGQFIPKDCDIYVLGVQEGINDRLYEAIQIYTETFQLPLMCHLQSAREADTSQKSRRLARAINAQRMLDDVNEGKEFEEATSQADMLDRVWGRGDGAFIHPKFTGIAVFVQPVFAPYVRLLGVYKHAFGASEGSKGGAAVALGIYDTTMAFVTAHMARRRAEARRQQYMELTERFGAKLGGRGYGLNESFHHVVWMGDLNYHCVGVSGDEAVKMISRGEHLLLLQKYDEFLRDREDGRSFHGFHEPVMPDDFLPTYKKNENRSPTDYSDPNWPKHVYNTKFKEPFYKGGRVMDRIPSYTDRVIYRSLPDRLGELSPMLEDENDPAASPHVYRSVNEGMDISDHAPVYAVFSLHVNIDRVDEWYENMIRQNDALGTPLDWAPEDLSMLESVPAESFARMKGFGTTGPLIVGPGAEEAPVAVKPVDIVVSVADVRVDFRGQMRTPRAVIMLFPLPFEDSDELPERAKVVRAGTVFSRDARSETVEKISGTIRHTVARLSKLPKLHLMLKVSLDDNTKAQCAVSLGEGGFTGLGEHSHTYFTPLSSMGNLVKDNRGRAINVQFVVHAIIHQENINHKGGQNHGLTDRSYREEGAADSDEESAASMEMGTPPRSVPGPPPPPPPRHHAKTPERKAQSVQSPDRTADARRMPRATPTESSSRKKRPERSGSSRRHHDRSSSRHSAEDSSEPAAYYEKRPQRVRQSPRKDVAPSNPYVAPNADDDSSVEVLSDSSGQI